MGQVLLSICLLCYSAGSFAQDNIDELKMVGFACFYEGRETKVVRRFGKLLEQKKYSKIKGMLKSANTAKVYLSVVCLERLETNGEVIISAKDKSLIEKIRKSTELVAVCSGCIPHPGIELKDAFDSGILWGTTTWLDRHAKF